jgi:hypothetical protein
MNNNIVDLIKFTQKNYNYILLSLIILLLITDYSIKIYIILILVIILLAYNYEVSERTPDKYNNDNRIKEILHGLKKYKKYNLVEYNRGKKKLFHILKIFRHHDKYENRNYQYDNLKFNISESLRHFNSILLSIPTNRHIDYINYNKHKNNYGDLSTMCKILHDYLYQELYNFGKKKTDDVITYNSNMISNDIVESVNFYNENDLY